MINCAVLGCGHGGQALAADLTERGCKVSLYAHPDHPGGINAIANEGGIRCKRTFYTFSSLSGISSDLQEAVEGSQYIFIALPSYAHES
jgi:opine dehydrogenase